MTTHSGASGGPEFTLQEPLANRILWVALFLALVGGTFYLLLPDPIIAIQESGIFVLVVPVLAILMGFLVRDALTKGVYHSGSFTVTSPFHGVREIPLSGIGRIEYASLSGSLLLYGIGGTLRVRMPAATAAFPPLFEVLRRTHKHLWPVPGRSVFRMSPGVMVLAYVLPLFLMGAGVHLLMSRESEVHGVAAIGISLVSLWTLSFPSIHSLRIEATGLRIFSPRKRRLILFEEIVEMTLCLIPGIRGGPLFLVLELSGNEFIKLGKLDVSEIGLFDRLAGLLPGKSRVKIGLDEK